MLFNRALSLLIASATVHQCAADEEKSANELPVLFKREFSNVEYGALEKRVDCPGGQCLMGTCCGDGCAQNCCGHDQGGVGCGMLQQCNFDGNVFIGCCGNLMGGCTGEPTRITIHTPYRTVTFKTDAPNTNSAAAPTADATSATGLSTHADSSSSTSSATSTKTTSSSTSSTGIGHSTTTSDKFGLSTSETTSGAASTITSNSGFGSESSLTSNSWRTPTWGAAPEETTASVGAAGKSFGVMEVGPLLAFGAWFLGTA